MSRKQPTSSRASLIPVANCESWTYTTLVHRGACYIDGEVIRMRFRVTLRRPRAAPDVLEVERLCREMAKGPDTLEGYTTRLANRLGCRVVGAGRTRTHGRIVCEVYPTREGEESG